jgi:Toprim domain
VTTEESAQRVLDNAGQLRGPVVEAYYAWRGLDVPETKNLWFVASLKHRSGASYPAIIALATNAAGVMTGIQRMWLAQDGSGKAPVPKGEQKMSLGLIKGSVVRLAESRDGVPLLIGEGVETTLTPMQATGYPGLATLGTSGLKAVGAPDGAKDVILLGENDGGKSAAAIAKAAPELKKKGVCVRVAYPPEGFKDFNDMVKDAPDRSVAYEAVRKAIEDAADFVDPLDDLVERVKQNPGAPFELETLKLLADLRRDDPSRFEQLRAQLKKETSCRITELDKRLDQLGGGGGDDRSPSEILVDLATSAENEFFHTDLDDGFAFVNVGKHRETHKIKSRYFTRWLTEKFFRLTGGAPSKPALEQAVATLEAIALFDGDEREVFVRVAAYKDKICVDLCDAERRVIEIDAKGWRIIANAPVHFHRIRGMLPLPVPVAGGSIQLLRPFLNIEPANKEGGDDPSGQFTLTIGWIVGAFRGNGPYAILVALGEQGAAKTTFCRLMRDLVDPNFALSAIPPLISASWPFLGPILLCWFTTISPQSPTGCRMRGAGAPAGRERGCENFIPTTKRS